MPSSVIQAYKFIPDKEILIITFVSGKRYQYMKVSESEYEDFKNAFSKGTHFNKYIKPYHPMKKLD